MTKNILAALVGISLVVSSYANSITVRPTLVRDFNTNSYRAGLSAPIKDLNYGFSLDGWLLARSPEFTTSYLGLGISRNLFERDNFSLGVTGGWSGNFSNLKNITEGSWGVGVVASFSF